MISMEIKTVIIPLSISRRLFEWMTSLMMLGMAFVIAINPSTVKVGGFYLLSNIGITAPVLAVLSTLIGCIRIAALFANGLWPLWGPRFRAGCALFAAILWIQMFLALLAWSKESGYISIGIAVYLFLALGEFISCYRAGTDGNANCS